MQADSEVWKQTLEAVIANPEFSLLDVSSETLREKLETRLPSIDRRTSEGQKAVRDAEIQEETAEKNCQEHRVFPWNLIFWIALAIVAALIFWHPEWWIYLIAPALFFIGAYGAYRVR